MESVLYICMYLSYAQGVLMVISERDDYGVGFIHMYVSFLYTQCSNGDIRKE